MGKDECNYKTCPYCGGKGSIDEIGTDPCSGCAGIG